MPCSATPSYHRGLEIFSAPPQGLTEQSPTWGSPLQISPLTVTGCVQAPSSDISIRKTGWFAHHPLPFGLALSKNRGKISLANDF